MSNPSNLNIQQRAKLLTPTKPVLQNEIRDSSFFSRKEKSEINWVHTLLLTLTPILALYGSFTTKLTYPTLILAIFMYFWTGLGITGGKTFF